jgi:methyl-accepting chemotaxis protein WspA
MKSMTIWQRLNTVLMLLTIFLMAGAGLSFWVERSRSRASERIGKLNSGLFEIYYQVMRITDSLRDLAQDPKSELEKKRRLIAEAELRERIRNLQAEFADSPELLLALRNFYNFVFGGTPGSLGYFETRVLEMIDINAANALTYYNANHPELRLQRDREFRELGNQINDFNNTESARASKISLIGVTCLILLLAACVIVGRFQSSSIAEPLNRLVATLERMGQGDFSQRLTLGQNDEFGVVSRGLNRLADDLCDLVGQVQRSGLQVNTTATEIAATAKEQQSTAREIAATTVQIGATSRQISTTSKDLVKTMSELNAVAEATANLADDGKTALNRMETTMRQIMEASGSITGKLAALSEKTANINSVVTTITKVADQTNLLSLNAAIEAEKAGEYGLGFAVVAIEIRRLADQTAVATYDIEKMVKEMQSAVATGVMGMDKFSEEVRRGVEEVRQVSGRLAQIIHQVQTLSPRVQIVNEGMHAQAAGAEQISETLTQLSEAAQQTAESLRQSNLAIDHLNGAARGLQASVARFKLGNGAERTDLRVDGYPRTG